MKKLSVFIIIIVFVSAVIGIVARQTHSNISAMDIPLEQFHVAMLDGDFAVTLAENMKEQLFEQASEISTENLSEEEQWEYDMAKNREANYILRVVPIENMEVIFMDTLQKVEVLEVYRGDGLAIGDEIFITAYSGLTQVNQSTDIGVINTVNMGFVNELKSGEEYLVFLNSKINTVDSKEIVYQAPEYIITPFFSCTERDNNIAITESEESTYVSYSEVSSNEFFVSSQLGIEALNDLKSYLLNKLIPN